MGSASTPLAPLFETVRKFVRKEFQRHRSAEFCVLGLVNYAHPAATQLLHDAVVREDPSDKRVGARHGPVILGRASTQVNESARHESAEHEDKIQLPTRASASQTQVFCRRHTFEYRPLSIHRRCLVGLTGSLSRRPGVEFDKSLALDSRRDAQAAKSRTHPQPDPVRDGQIGAGGRLVNSLNVERPHYYEPSLLLGTSAFTANGWPGAFYPPGMKPRDFLSYYARQFQTVEIDSTYYATPSASTVTNWYERTPPDFIFAAKVPQVITHEKVLVDCEAEFDEFVDRMDILDEKLGPLLLQFPWFNKYEMQADEFFRRLRFFLQRVKDLPAVRFAVEIRNRAWLDKRLTDLLREYIQCCAGPDRHLSDAASVGEEAV